MRFGVEVVAEDELAAEDTRGRSVASISTRIHVRALRAHRHYIALDVEIQGLFVDAGQVEFDDELLPSATRPSASPRVEPPSLTPAG